MASNKVRKSRNLRTILIEPFKQIKLGLYVLAVALTFVIVTAALFITAFTEQYAHVMEIFQVVDPKFKWELVTNDIFMTNALRIAAVLIAFIAVLFTVIFRTTHKYYGPLVSIERFVEALADGDYSKRVVIRRGDELQRLAGRLNFMAEKLQERHGVPNPRRRAQDDGDEDLETDKRAG